MNLIGVAMGEKRVVKIPYTRLEEEETLIENRTVFFANQLNFGVKLPWVWTVEIRNFTQIRQKYFARKSLSFRNIFAISIRLI